MSTAAKTVYSHITKDPEVCGGKACIDGTRIRVMDIVSLKRQGHSPEEMLEAYPSLNPYEHPEEIAASFEEDRSCAGRTRPRRDRILAEDRPVVVALERRRTRGRGCCCVRSRPIVPPA